MKCVKDEDGKMLVEAYSLKWRLQAYYHKLLNDRGDKVIVWGDLVHSERLQDFEYCRHFKFKEVAHDTSRMYRGRVAGPDEILMEF